MNGIRELEEDKQVVDGNEEDERWSEVKR